MKTKALALILCLVFVLSAVGLTGCQQANSAQAGTPTNTAAQASAAQSENPQAQATAQSGSEKTKITFMGWGTDKEIATFKTMIGQFEAKYPEVQVEYIVVADNEFDSKLQTMIGANQCPDVFYCPIDKMMKYAATGNLYKLTDYVAHNEIFDPNNVWDCLINLYRFDGKTQGTGDIYALPKDVSVFPIFYNVDLFKAAGVTPPTADKPWDWNDYLAAAKKLTTGEGDNKIYGSGAYSLESAVWSNGAEWVDPQTLTKVTIDDPAFIEALQWCADLRLVHHVVPTVAESDSLSDYDRFKQGKLAMVGTGTWSLADLWANCNFKWDVMNWPVSPRTGKSEIWFGSAGLAVSAATKHAEAACNLAAYLAFNEDAQRTAYTMGQAIPMLKDMAYGEYMKLDKAPASKQVFFDILTKNARLATQSRTFNQDWFAEFNSNTASVFSGETTAQQYCTSIKDKLQQLLDDSIVQRDEYVSK